MSIGPARSYGLIIPKANYITSIVRQGTISKEAAKRLRWMDHYNRYWNARLTCRYYDIFDAESRFIVKVPLKSSLLLIKRGKLYTVEEDEEGYQHVKRYEVTWDMK